MTRPCPTCGCGGHGQTVQVRCVRCREWRWPILPAAPGPEYVCTRCVMDTPRQQAGRRSAETRRGKAPAVVARPRGGIPGEGAA
jgi:hypothetical protein